MSNRRAACCVTPLVAGVLALLGQLDRIGSALRGENPTVLRRLKAGFAVIGDVQFLPGYSVLLADDPEAERLSDLPRQKRLAFLSDMDHLGEAVERVSRRADPAFRRVNLEILGIASAYGVEVGGGEGCGEPVRGGGEPVGLGVAEEVVALGDQ